MKAWATLLVSLTCFASANAKKFKLDDPPFYTMTFEEITDLPIQNKEKYFNGLLRYLRQLKAVHGEKVIGIASLEALDELSRNQHRWNKMREQTFRTCQLSANKKVCRGLLDLRQTMFEIHAGSHAGTYGSGESH